MADDRECRDHHYPTGGRVPSTTHLFGRLQWSRNPGDKDAVLYVSGACPDVCTPEQPMNYGSGGDRSLGSSGYGSGGDRSLGSGLRQRRRPFTGIRLRQRRRPFTGISCGSGGDRSLGSGYGSGGDHQWDQATAKARRPLGSGYGSGGDRSLGSYGMLRMTVHWDTVTARGGDRSLGSVKRRTKQRHKDTDTTFLSR
jgi:hypothetical protein